jgi:hypothetical protein
MMMPSQMDVLQQALDKELQAADIKLVGKYVKDVLFEKMVFLWDRKALDTNGKLHKDYLENCQPLLANGKLVPLSKEEARPYMNLVWNLMVKDGCYNNWLSNKRSNSYQAVQNSFMSE